MTRPACHVQTARKEIERLKAEGPTEKQVSDVREAMLRGFETNIKQNGYLLTQIAGKYKYGGGTRDRTAGRSGKAASPRSSGF